MAASTNLRSEANGQRSEKKDSTKAAADDVFAKPPEENSSSSSLPAPRAESAPQPLAPPPAVSDITATLTGSLLAANGGVDADNDGKADPGDTISYIAKLTSSGAGGTGLSFSNPLDSHTMLVGSVNSTPVTFDQTVNLNEDGTVNITIQGQDPDGTVAPTLVFRNPSTHAAFGASTSTAHGTLGAFGAMSCDGAGVCSSTATYTPAADYNGSDNFTFEIFDGTAVSDQVGTVSINVAAVNDAPTFSGSNDPPAINEDAGAQSVTSFRTAVTPGPANESSQTPSFVVTNVTHSALFASQPAINVIAPGGPFPTTATLTYTPAANANGTSVVTYHLHDNGGTANGGVDNSPDQTFTITVNAVNDAPVAQPKAFTVQANMKITGLSGLLTGVTDLCP